MYANKHKGTCIYYPNKCIKMQRYKENDINYIKLYYKEGSILFEGEVKGTSTISYNIFKSL